MTTNITQPLVSIVTICYNCADTIEKTIESVISQSYSNIEYIIVDGGSTDGTLDIIKKNEEYISKWISEPDEGISDAFNKGIAMANGDYIQLVNADDWLSDNQIELAVATISNTEYGFVFGDMLMYDQECQPQYLQKGEPHYFSKIKYGMPMLNHPTVMVKKELYCDVGDFDKQYKIAMDYDWLLRTHLAGYQGVYSKEIVGNMRLCGVSDENFEEAYKEVMNISISYGASPTAARLLLIYKIAKRRLRLLCEKLFTDNFVLRLRKLINKTVK